MKIQFDIDSYKTKFSGGIKQYLFFAVFTFPSNLSVSGGWNTQNAMQSMLSPLGYNSNDNVFPYLVRATNLPDSTFEEVIIPFPGIPIKMAGTRTFGDWTVSFNVDSDGKLIHAFNKWHNLIYDAETQIPSSKKQYAKNQQLFILDNYGMATERIELFDAWPKAIGQVTFDYSSSDLATMDVTFSYDRYTIKNENETSPANKGILQAAISKVTGSANFGGLF